MQYPAVVSREGKYVLAEFPDCPGCQTFVEEGESIEDAAREALEGWLESNLGRDLVPPRPSKSLRNDGQVLFVLVDPLLAVRLDLRWARDDASLTQAKLAQRVGMSQQQLAKLEAGGNPTLSTLSRVAEGLGRRVIVLLEKRSEREPAVDTGSYQLHIHTHTRQSFTHSRQMPEPKPVRHPRVAGRPVSTKSGHVVDKLSAEERSVNKTHGGRTTHKPSARGKGSSRGKGKRH